MIGVLLTSVLVYYISIANNDKARAGYEIAAHDEDAKKATEQYKVSIAAVSGSNLNINIANEGPIPVRASQMILYCIEGAGCAPTVPITTATISTTVNTGTSSVQSIGSVVSGSKYRVDVISERGNIVSSSCDFDGTECIVDGSSEGELGGLVNEGIIQGTGSLQLDFNSFGAVFPELAQRSNVDQTGWKVVTSSRYGSATGYPAFDIPQGLQTVIVEKVRNLDLSGKDLTLNRNTALIVNVGKTTSGQPDPNYICYADKSQQQITLQPYDENSVFKTTLPWTDIKASKTEGWQEVYFCSTSPSTATNPWTPDARFNNINGIFMVARGTFSGTHAEYSQTVPYQAVMVGQKGISQLNACLRNGDVSNTCPDPKSAPSSSNNPSSLKYSETASNLANNPSSRQLYIHINTASPNNPNSPFDVAWVYSNGDRVSLVSGASLNGPNRNIPITLPNTLPDGSPITPGYYTIVVNDSYSSSSTRNIYYMTFQVTP